jgi:hypothetical protein
MDILSDSMPYANKEKQLEAMRVVNKRFRVEKMKNELRLTVLTNMYHDFYSVLQTLARYGAPKEQIGEMVLLMDVDPYDKFSQLDRLFMGYEVLLTALEKAPEGSFTTKVFSKDDLAQRRVILKHYRETIDKTLECTIK